MHNDRFFPRSESVKVCRSINVLIWDNFENVQLERVMKGLTTFVSVQAGNSLAKKIVFKVKP